MIFQTLATRFDYIARDTVNCGMSSVQHLTMLEPTSAHFFSGDKCNLVTSRLVNSCRVVDGHICYQYKDFFTVHEVGSRCLMQRAHFDLQYFSCFTLDIRFINGYIITRLVRMLLDLNLPRIDHCTILQAKAIEYMLVDALVAADPILKLSDTIYDAEKYLFVTDSVVEEIERSTNPVSVLQV